MLASDGQAMIQEWVEDMVPVLDNFDVIINDIEHAVAIGALLGRMTLIRLYGSSPSATLLGSLIKYCRDSANRIWIWRTFGSSSTLCGHAHPSRVTLARG